MSNHLSNRTLMCGIVASLLFACAFYQLPLFAINQNSYFIHGLAQAGYGFLAEDWLGRQTDHIPLFSALDILIHDIGYHGIFRVLLAVMAGVYAASLAIIAAQAQGETKAKFWLVPQLLLFFALFTLLHVEWLLDPFAQGDLKRPVILLQRLANAITNGVAGQTILGPFFQPSTFGVLMLTSIACFVQRREYSAIVCAVIAAWVHPTYLLHAAILTAVYMLALTLESKSRQALTVGGLALILVLPIVLYVAVELRPTSPALLAQAQSILVDERIPHHAKISVWFSYVTWLKLAVAVAGILAAWPNRRLFLVLGLCGGISALLSALQELSGSKGFALLFPWRLSTWLVPAGLAILLGRVVALLLDGVQRLPARAAAPVRTSMVAGSVIILVLTAFLGLRETLEGSPKNDPTIAYAAAHGAPDQTYLIPLDYSNFRLSAAVPVFVDWKSHPYRDVELIEWHTRTQLAKDFYKATNATDAERALAAIRAHTSITHVVLESDDELRLPIVGGTPLFRDEKHIVVELQKD